MKKFKFLFLSLFLLLSSFSLLVSFAKPAHAANAWKCKILNPPTITVDNKTLSGITISTGTPRGEANPDTKPENNNQYYVYMLSGDETDGVGLAFWTLIKAPTTTDSDGNIIITGTFDRYGYISGDTLNPGPFREGSLKFRVYAKRQFTPFSDSLCGSDNMSINVLPSSATGGQYCGISYPEKSEFKPGDKVVIKVDFKDKDMEGSDPSHTNQLVTVTGRGTNFPPTNVTSNILTSGSYSLGTFGGGEYQIKVERQVSVLLNKYCTATFGIAIAGGYAGCGNDDTVCVNACDGKPNCLCLPPVQSTGNTQAGGTVCRVPEGNEQVRNPCAQNGTSFDCQTAIGKINSSPSGFAKNALQLFLSIAGLIFLAFLIINGYKLMTSAGEEEKVKEAREAITSAIIGIAVIIFSIVILQIITIDLLHLPGFSAAP